MDLRNFPKFGIFFSACIPSVIRPWPPTTSGLQATATPEMASMMNLKPTHATFAVLCSLSCRLRVGTASFVLSSSPSSATRLLHFLAASRAVNSLLLYNRVLATTGAGRSSVAVRRRLGSVRAAQVNEPGSIDSSMMKDMARKIKEQLNADSAIVKDAYGDGRHVSIYVISSAFEGQSAVNRQRMVYKAIWEELQSTVHAVDQMITKTPAEEAGNEASD